MALYEYRCKKCAEEFELMRRVADRDKLAVCPECGSRSTARLQVQAFATLTGAQPDAAMGEGDAEDFLDEHGPVHAHDLGHDHGHDHGLDMDDMDF